MNSENSFFNNYPLPNLSPRGETGKGVRKSIVINNNLDKQYENPS